MTKKKTSELKTKDESAKTSEKEKIIWREHAEFHNCFSTKSVLQDLRFLSVIYGEKLPIKEADVTQNFVNSLKIYAKDIYFFIASIEKDITPQIYIKRKYEFIQTTFPKGSKHLFFLAWNGLIKNDSFKKILLQKFSLSRFNDFLCPKNIPVAGSMRSRYRTKLVLADDMAKNPDGTRRYTGRTLDDGSGLSMKEEIVWLPNGKSLPLFPQGYVPLNQTQVILIRHGKSIHESGGDNPEFVGSGYWDQWQNNRRISNSIGNNLKPEGIGTAKDLGKDFKVAVDTLTDKGYPLWSWSKEKPVMVFGSESENTEQTARYFLQEAGYTNISFYATFGLNSQKYGSLTHKFKNDIIKEAVKIYGEDWEGTEKEHQEKIKKMFKNRFFHYPEGETLIEADWRIGFSFTELLRQNQGKRVVLADHSGAIRVFEAIIRTLDFADYCTLKEAQDSIMVLCFQPGRNLRYDYLQKKDFLLRKK